VRSRLAQRELPPPAEWSFTPPQGDGFFDGGGLGIGVALGPGLGVGKQEKENKGDE